MRRKQDHYAREARAAGYPARSVYKLREIQKRFTVLEGGMRVLDIGAAPGSWTMYAAEAIGARGSLVAVDLAEMRIPDRPADCTFVQGDIHDEPVRRRIASFAPFECVLSDAAPATTGNRTVDSARSAAIVESVLDLCREVLREGGNLVVKLFQGPDQQRLLGEVRNVFAKAKQVKPEASRKGSFEVFLVATGFRGATQGDRE